MRLINSNVRGSGTMWSPSLLMSVQNIKTNVHQISSLSKVMFEYKHYFFEVYNTIIPFIHRHVTWFAPRPGHTKDTIKWYRLSPAWNAGVSVGFWLWNLINRRVVRGTVYGDFHYTDQLESIAREGYCIAVPDIYLVLHDIWLWTITLLA